jgi:uncharacterized protein YbaP (TraB family)
MRVLFRKSKEKELRMVLEVQIHNRKSVLVGTAHFFPYSFKTSLLRYIKDAQTVLLEGPLDNDSMAKVVRAGMQEDNVPHLFEQLDKKTIAGVCKAMAPAFRQKRSFLLLDLLNPIAENPVYAMIKGMKPWLAFFTLWSSYLKRNGWCYSVDLEAYETAREMGKEVVFLETIEEQIAVLESLSHQKIIDFLKRVDNWNTYANEYVKCYLSGDFAKLRSVGFRFPSRHYNVIDRRDQIFYERMLTYLENGDAVVCVGAPHLRGIAELLRAAGYQARGFQL